MRLATKLFTILVFQYGFCRGGGGLVEEKGVEF